MASASPRRAALIRKIPWLNAAVFPSCAEEEPFAGGDVAAYTQRLAASKAKDVLLRAGGVVIGADTVVCVDGNVLGKPKTEAEAERMFRLPCGRTHEVITGYCVMSAEKSAENHEKTLVTFGPFDEAIVFPYIRSGAPFDKAGGYGLQDAALRPLIRKIEGDTDNVVGLPVRTLEKTLKEFF